MQFAGAVIQGPHPQSPGIPDFSMARVGRYLTCYSKWKDVLMEEPNCSFCGKSQSQVRRIFGGSADAFICDECVEFCANILESEGIPRTVGANSDDVTISVDPPQ